MARRTKVEVPRARTEAERLGWALWFAQADLGEWRDGDWLNALEDVEDLAFTGGAQPARGYLGLIPVKGQPEVPKIKAWLTPLQEAIRDFIERLDKERGEALCATPSLQKEGAFIPINIPFKGEAKFVAAYPYRRLGVAYAPKDPSARDAFITGMVLRVGDLLTRIDLSRLKRCPECNRLFLAVRRQRFDTAQCSLRDRVRRFRQNPARRRARRRRT